MSAGLCDVIATAAMCIFLVFVQTSHRRLVCVATLCELLFDVLTRLKNKVYRELSADPCNQSRSFCRFDSASVLWNLPRSSNQSLLVRATTHMSDTI